MLSAAAKHSTNLDPFMPDEEFVSVVVSRVQVVEIHGQVMFPTLATISISIFVHCIEDCGRLQSTDDYPTAIEPRNVGSLTPLAIQGCSPLSGVF